MSGVRYMCPILAGFGLSWQVFMKFSPSVMFYGNPSCGSRLNTCGRTDGRPDRQREKHTDGHDGANRRFFTIILVRLKSRSILLFSPITSGFIGDHQCGFRRNRSTTDHIFCIRQILEKNGNMMKQCISCL